MGASNDYGVVTDDFDGRNPERIVVIYYNNVDIISETYEKYSIGETVNSSISTTTLWFDDSNLRNAFECLEIIYIARN